MVARFVSRVVLGEYIGASDSLIHPTTSFLLPTDQDYTLSLPLILLSLVLQTEYGPRA